MEDMKEKLANLEVETAKSYRCDKIVFISQTHTRTEKKKRKQLMVISVEHLKQKKKKKTMYI